MSEYFPTSYLDGVVEQITVPFLVTHGENDRQIPVEYAHPAYDKAVNSPNRELRIFTPDEGATEHVGLDHLPHVGAYTPTGWRTALREMSRS